MIQVGIVGLGFGKQVHVPAFRACKNTQVAALLGSSWEKTVTATTELSLPKTFRTWEDLLADPEITVVALALPPRENLRHLSLALAARKHVFCEKPLGVGPTEAFHLAQAAEASGLVTAVDFEFPEIPAWRQARDLLGRGELGRILHFQLDWQLQTYANRHSVVSWKTDPTLGGGTLRNFVSHAFYNIEWFFGPVAALTCQIEQAERKLASVLFTLQSGVCGSVLASDNTPHCQRHRLEVFCEKGVLTLENLSPDYIHGFTLRLNGELLPLDCLSPAPFTDGRVAAVSSLLQRFLRRIEQPKAPSDFPTLAAGARVEFLLQQAQESHASGTRKPC